MDRTCVRGGGDGLEGPCLSLLSQLHSLPDKTPALKHKHTCSCCRNDTFFLFWETGVSLCS